MSLGETSRHYDWMSASNHSYAAADPLSPRRDDPLNAPKHHHVIVANIPHLLVSIPLTARRVNLPAACRCAPAHHGVARWWGGGHGPAVPLTSPVGARWGCGAAAR